GSRVFGACERECDGYGGASQCCRTFDHSIVWLFAHGITSTTAQLRPGTKGLAICHLCFASNDESLGNRGLVTWARVPLTNRRPGRPRSCTLYIVQGLSDAQRNF